MSFNDPPGRLGTDPALGRFIPDRAAARTVEAFSVRLPNEVDLDASSAELLAVVDQTIQPTRASLRLRPAAADSPRTAPWTSQSWPPPCEISTWLEDAGIPARVIDELMATSGAATGSWRAGAASGRAIATEMAVRVAAAIQERLAVVVQVAEAILQLDDSGGRVF
jgi:hypothetical protein